MSETFIVQYAANALLGADNDDVEADVVLWHAAGHDYIYLAPWYLHLFP